VIVGTIVLIIVGIALWQGKKWKKRQKEMNKAEREFREWRPIKRDIKSWSSVRNLRWSEHSVNTQSPEPKTETASKPEEIGLAL
jgi:hypothetical protein